MTSPIYRSRTPLSVIRSQKLIVAAIAGICSLQSLQASDVNWLTTTGSSTWSNAANWSAIPSTDGADTITFNALTGNVTSNIDSAWATSGSVNGLIFAADTASTNYTYSFLSGTNTSLTLGAGGITNYKTKGGISFGNNASTSGTLVIGANQTWSIISPKNWNASDININMNLSGTGNLTLSGSGAAYVFQSGNSTAYSGTMTLNSSDVRLSGSTQLGRLGSTLIFGNGTSTYDKGPSIFIENLSGAGQQVTQHTFATNLSFVNTGASTSLARTLSVTGSNSSLAVTGAWTGTMTNNLTLNSVGASTTTTDRDMVIRLQADNSGWSSTKLTSGYQANSAIWLQGGTFVLENANAWGTGNVINVSLGNNNSTTVDRTRASLFAIDGVNVASKIYANRNYNGTDDAAKSNVVNLGLSGTGSTAFTGAVTLETYDGLANHVKNRIANVHLIAGSSGTASFSGNFIDNRTDTGNDFVPVTAQGGGTVILSGSNSFRGGTNIIDSTTLLANNTQGSATGAGDLRVGYNGAASLSGTSMGTATQGSAVITGVNTTNLVVGQTVTGAGITPGTFITFIRGDRIELSLNTTVSGTTAVSFAAESETGVLGGTGRIAPGGVNGITTQRITVANGSSVAPGAINSIGTLTLDGGSTTAGLLTMDAGATFTFNLGASNQSDQIAFWNYAAGDILLNNNVINFTGAQEGSYTLFNFYSNAGTALTTSGIDTGLVIGTGLETFSYTLNYNTDSITLDVQAVPEPSTYALILMGLGAAGLCRRYRSRTA